MSKEDLAMSNAELLDSLGLIENGKLKEQHFYYFIENQKMGNRSIYQNWEIRKRF